MEIYEKWHIHHTDCPWYNDGNCMGEVSYNGHLNDKRYGMCVEPTCPFLYWMYIIEDKLNE